MFLLDPRLLLLGTLALVTPPTASGPHPTTTFQTLGPKTVTLKVCSATGACSTVTKTLTVLDPTPRILSVNVPASVGLLAPPVILTATGSGKPPLAYRWTLTHPDGSTTTISQASATFVPPGPGSYALSLSVSNAYGTTTAQKTLSVVPNVFEDVAPDFWATDAIETLFFSGITSGCDRSSSGYPLFCPNATVSRAEIAVLLGRTLHPPTFQPAAPAGLFRDVPSNFWAAAWIEQLARDGITGGCAPGLFCPSMTANRAEMAVLLERALHPAPYAPPPPSGLFADVPASFWAAPWIEQLARDGITTGCSILGVTRLFCPAQTLTRAELAVFLGTAFHLSQHPKPLRFQAALCTPTNCAYPAGMPLAFDVQLSGGIPTSYDYDWNGDGTFDESTVFPVFHVYSAPGTYTPRLRLRRGGSSATITHPYSIVISQATSNPSAPSSLSATAEALIPPAASDPPGTPNRTAYQISAPNQPAVSGYAVFVTAGSSYAFAGLLQPNRPAATDRLLLPPSLPGAAPRFFYVKSFTRSGYSFPSLPVRLP